MTKEQRCLANVEAWFDEKLPVDLAPVWSLRVQSDRVWYRLPDFAFRELDNWLLQGIRQKRFTIGSHALHGDSAFRSYREAVPFASLQVTWHHPEGTAFEHVFDPGDKICEVDFDAGNPTFDELADAPALVLHGLEVLKNKLFRRKTNPFRIAWMLRKRGILPKEG